MCRRRQPVELTGPKRTRILALLAAECGNSVSIDRLVTALWDRPPKTAVKTVRVQVREIRRRLQAGTDIQTAPIETTPGGYQLGVAPHQVDLHRFRSLVRKGEVLLRSGSAEQAADRFRDALDLWHQPPLPSLADLADLTPLVAEAESLALAAREGTLLSRLELGQHAALLTEVDELLAREPLREELYAIAMLALYREGRQADALDLYQRARAVLRDELGVEPSERLRDLELAILEQRGDLLEDGEPGHSGNRRWTSGSFIGRSQELVALGEAWRGAKEGIGSIVLIVGEPGVGKTRLARELADELRADGVTQSWASCAAIGRGVPFGAVAACFEQLAGVDVATADATEHHRDGLSTSSTGEGDALEVGRGRQQRLIDEAIGALRTLSSRRPLLLVLDDLHDADHATASWLLQLGQVIGHLPVLLVATQRSIEADVSSGLSAVLPQLLRLDRTLRMSLAPLDRAETERYLASVLGGSPEPDLVEAIWRRASGNLLFTVELAALSQEEGAVPSAGSLPEALRQYVRGRLDGLAPGTRDLIDAAAVIGADIPESVIVSLAGDGFTPSSLEDLIDRRLLTRSSPGRYRFTHELVREAVYELLPADHRDQLHRSAANALETQALVDPAVLADVARHRCAALPADADRCIDACLSASRHAVALAAFDDATGWCARAIEASAHRPDDSRRRLAAELLHGEASMRSGARDAARDHLDVALRLARASGDATAFARAAFFRAADGIPTRADAPATVAALAEANDMLGDQDSELKVRMLDFLSLVDYQDGGRAAVPLADEALARAERMRDPRVLALACNGRAMADAGPDDTDDRLALAARGIEAARRADDQESAIVGRLLRLMTLLEVGRADDADAELDLVDRLAAERREPRFQWMAEGWKGVAALRTGDLEEAERRYADGLGAWRDRPVPEAVVAHAMQLVALRLLQGRADEVLPLVQAAGVERGGGHAWLGVRALTAAHAGDEADARRSLLECLATDPASWRRDLSWSISMSTAAEACWLLADTNGAERLAPLVTPMADHHVVVTALGTGGAYWGCLAYPAGLLAAVLDDGPRAGDLLRQAIEEHRRVGARPFEQRSLEALDALA